jgi:hypothetical protein
MCIKANTFSRRTTITNRIVKIKKNLIQRGGAYSSSLLNFFFHFFHILVRVKMKKYIYIISYITTITIFY